MRKELKNNNTAGDIFYGHGHGAFLGTFYGFLLRRLEPE